MSQVPGSGSQWSPGGGGYMTTGGPAMALVSKGILEGVPVALTVISLVGVGKFFKAAGALRAANAALVRLYQTGRIPFIGGSTYYPPGWIGPAATIAGGTVSTWFTPSSAGGGGPGEIPNLHRPPPSIEEAGEILSNPGIMVEVPSSPRRSTSKRSRKVISKCPKGQYWDPQLRICVRKWTTGEKRAWNRRFAKKG